MLYDEKNKSHRAEASKVKRSEMVITPAIPSEKAHKIAEHLHMKLGYWGVGVSERVDEDTDVKHTVIMMSEGGHTVTPEHKLNRPKV